MNKKLPNSFRIYMWIIDTFRRHQPLSFEQFNERWQAADISDGEPVHRNTFRRYLDGIEEMFGINIEYDRRANLYSIPDGKAFQHNSLQRWMLSTMSVAGVVRESRSLQKRIVLESVPSGDLLLVEITRAMENNKMLHLTYRKFVDSEPYQCDVEPYCLRLFRQRWYLLAHRTDRSYLAIYALDRMISVQESDATFVLPADFDAEQYFAPMYGVFQPSAGQQPEEIRLRTYQGEWNYLRTLPLHSSQQEVIPRYSEDSDYARAYNNNEYVDFRLCLCPTHDFCMELLSRGQQIEVIEPASLRDRIRQMILACVDRYKQGN